MKSADQIPYYAPDGSSMGFRTLEAAKRLIAGGYVKPAYGRKGHLKAIWLLQKDGGNPVETHPRAGTRYSFLQSLDNGTRCWKASSSRWAPRRRTGSAVSAWVVSSETMIRARLQLV